MVPRPKPSSARGSSLIEVMAALAIVTFGAAGTFALQQTSNTMMGGARKSTRAAAYAQDLVNQIQLWSFDDARLANDDTSNDADVGDSAALFQALDDPPFDHDEADLRLGGAVWTGLGETELEANGMQRFWNVAYPDDANANGVPDAARVAVIVRWQQSGGWRRLVLVTTKVNPADRR